MTFISNGPDDGPLFLFAHGAGAPSDSNFMERIAIGLADKGILVIRFNFDYMQQRIQTGSKRPPERAPKLINQFETIINQLTEKSNRPLVIGGKSMGGRMASLVASKYQENGLMVIKGVACLGFPFHPAGKPQKLRTEHFDSVKSQQLIIQGTRDKLGSFEEVKDYHLPDDIKWAWLEDGDHDFKPRVKSGFTHEQHINTTIEHLAGFIKQTLSV
ncbi:alpha/beta hydrolase [Psychromonas sp. psych-6C06]|uniref:alpha/beta family hydrolase n=1 Tax=Psychromonas sp. psych-6C06 TaxID=2058089 RepID=UPI000C31D6CB|nr:alpha/beta family hydrolase [Psychromonas sp. psych-6C06]PKF60506.1 alpha/beta hydrolase [Psychromonas sp. psych-6C06]